MSAESTNSNSHFHYQLLCAWLKSSWLLAMLSLALLVCGVMLSVHYEQLMGLLSHVVIALVAQYLAFRLYMDGQVFQALSQNNAGDKLDQLDASLRYLFNRKIDSCRTFYERFCTCRRLYVYFALALVTQFLSIVRQIIYILYF